MAVIGGCLSRCFAGTSVLLMGAIGDALPVSECILIDISIAIRVELKEMIIMSGQRVSISLKKERNDGSTRKPILTKFDAIC